jgi:type VI secretion system Hcp family effector
MKQYAFSLLIALFALSFARPANPTRLARPTRPAHPTAFHSYASFKGKKQGQFKGESTKTGREKDGWFEITSFEMGSEVPVDPKSGRPSAKAQHNPVVIRKEVDQASPLLLNAHVSNETFETVIIQTVDDHNKVVKTTTLKNALISEIRKSGTLESISFNYEDIMIQQ